MRLRKVELQKLACEPGIETGVCRLPPGTSKRNRIEHKLFSFISRNRFGKPLFALFGHATINSLIDSATTGTGLKACCDRDTNGCPTGVNVGNSELAALDIRRAGFHGDWNCTLLPAPDYAAVMS